MTFTYDVAALSEDLNRIRLEIGDTDSNRPLLDDEEIEEVMTEFDNFNQRVGKCLRLICAIFASEHKSIRLEGFAENYADAYNHFKDLAVRYERLGGGGPWAGSTNEAFKEATELDTSIVTPFFKRGLHDNS